MLKLPTISFAKAFALGVALVLIGGQAAQARDTVTILPVSDVLAMAPGKKGLDGSVAFYFGNSHHPKVISTSGNFVTNRKTNSFNKTDVEACKWAMLSALITLQDRAHTEGGNAVINIKSYYWKKEVSYDNDYECHAGTFVSGVTLKGDVVKLKK